MEMSRITGKYQATVPADARNALGVGAGDQLLWQVADGVVTVRKAEPLDMAFAAAVAITLDEWGSEADEKAFSTL